MTERKQATPACITYADGVAAVYSNEGLYHLLQQQLPRSAGAGGAPLHRFAVPLALSGEAYVSCNVCNNPQRKWLP